MRININFVLIEVQESEIISNLYEEKCEPH